MHISLAGGRETRLDEATSSILVLGSRLASREVVGVLRRLLAQCGRRLQLDAVVAAGLRRAWNADGTVSLLNSGWNLVLIVESAARISRDPDRYEAMVRVLGFAARAAGCGVALVEPPVLSATDGDWRRIERAVAAAASAAQAAVLPLGTAWRLALAAQPRLQLHLPRGRLTLLGAYLAACTVASYICGEPLHPLELPGVPSGYPALAHRVVQEALRHAGTSAMTRTNHGWEGEP